MLHWQRGVFFHYDNRRPRRRVYQLHANFKDTFREVHKEQTHAQDTHTRTHTLWGIPDSPPPCCFRTFELSSAGRGWGFPRLHKHSLCEGSLSLAEAPNRGDPAAHAHTPIDKRGHAQTNTHRKLSSNVNTFHLRGDRPIRVFRSRVSDVPPRRRVSAL